ncbi:hypothetical protein [Streptomyces sp. SP18CS02]|uniref:hypothetical protein n=1 Tax=Streptomyces sp. SP18CS02 TaxID=3002531 RepID=UPI002E75A151|nr:hypothetical protein [Streptomyces sp. SP18CS02]MEE1752999.1 hypothetical protein [Streptomyces sp. SP18CS02]
MGAVEGDDESRLFGGLLAQGCVLSEQDGDDGSGCVDLVLKLLSLLPIVPELASKISDLLRLPLVVETCGLRPMWSSQSASTSVARFMVARLTPASRQRLFFVSLPSVWAGRPVNSRSTASRSAFSARAETLT